ncbi:penicillin-binding protein activator [Vibrio sp. MA40-2]|uniref:penicillin-binding protein activator n=1 Tax=Vibrio sp. MA40-2 TaxID=3391828 RepID=UPI0039A53420
MARKNQQQISVTRLVTSIALAITLAACSSQPNVSNNVDITTDPTLSAQAYTVKADSLQGSIQNDWLIMALKAAIQEGDLERSNLLIMRLEKQQLSEQQQAELILAKAKYFIAQGQPTIALEQLNFPQWWKLPVPQWKDYHQLRAVLLTQQKNHLDASREYIVINQLDPQDQPAKLAENIWQNLSQYSQYEINSFSPLDSEVDLQGWLQLAIYMKTLNTNIPQLKSALETWLVDNPTHLAATYLPSEIQAILDLDIIQPQNTALLLPISGRYETQAKLVRDGFLMSLMNDPERNEDATLSIIDTNKTTNAEIDQILNSKQIDFIVGPLIKDKIEAIIALQASKVDPIPILALNFPNEINTNSDICYLTLSPEQEVEQAAKYLFAQGFKFPLILAPKGSLGGRVATAFQNEWKKYSNTQAVVSYFGTTAQLQQDINTVLGIKESQSRIAQMENLVGMQLEHQARSRRDIDSMYIISKSSELTLIKPFIEVAINPEVKPPKLFASSRSNNGSQRQFEDLSGVVFSDIPMLIDSDNKSNQQVDEIWPNQNNAQKRLQALGMDAYKLINELPQMKVIQGHKVAGQTGELSIDENCVVQRELSWAEHNAL